MADYNPDNNNEELNLDGYEAVPKAYGYQEYNQGFGWSRPQPVEKRKTRLSSFMNRLAAGASRIVKKPVFATAPLAIEVLPPEEPATPSFLFGKPRVWSPEATSVPQDWPPAPQAADPIPSLRAVPDENIQPTIRTIHRPARPSVEVSTEARTLFEPMPYSNEVAAPLKSDQQTEIVEPKAPTIILDPVPEMESSVNSANEPSQIVETAEMPETTRLRPMPYVSDASEDTPAQITSEERVAEATRSFWSRAVGLSSALKEKALHFRLAFKSDPVPSLPESKTEIPEIETIVESTKIENPALTKIKEAGGFLRRLGGCLAKAPSTVATRAAETGRSLADRETRMQTAKELAINVGFAGVAKIAFGSAAAFASAPLLASVGIVAAGTGVVGGLLKSRRQYLAAKEEFEKTSDGQEEFHSLASHILNNKKQLGLNVLGSTVSGAVGGVIGLGTGHLLHQAWEHFSAVSTVAPLAAPIAPKLEIDTSIYDPTNTVTAKPALTPEAPVIAATPVPVSAPTALSPLDDAISRIQATPKLMNDQMVGTIELARQGNGEAILKIKDVINTDGIRADDYLVDPLEKLVEEENKAAEIAAQPAPITAPLLELQTVPLAPQPDLNTLQVPLDLDVYDAAKLVAGGTTIAGTGALIGAYGTQAGIALSLATNKPANDVAPITNSFAAATSIVPSQNIEQARIAKVLEMREAGIPLLANKMIGLQKGVCIISNTFPKPGTTEPTRSAACGEISPGKMQEGDFIRIIGEDTNIETAAIMDAKPGVELEPLDFVFQKIVGIKKTFNELLDVVSHPATEIQAPNDNQVAEAPAPQAFAVK